MEAGLEHLSRSTTRGSDVMLVVAEPYYKSLETADRVNKMAAELGIPHVYIVANKVRTETDAQAIDTFCSKRNLEIISTIPYDEQVAAASMIPSSPLDTAPQANGVAAVEALAETIKTRFLN
jgi:CO dehydrogenase maturation factor